MSAGNGHCRIYRRVLEDDDFNTPAEALAFVYLILKAAWRPTTVRYKGWNLSLARGQLAVSLRDMAVDLEWPKTRVARFLDRLKTAGKIGTGGGTPSGTASGHPLGHPPTVVTICKYEAYQLTPRLVGTGDGPEPGQDRDSSGTQNKEGKEVKDSVPDGTGVEALEPDFKKLVFDTGKRLLIQAGTPAKQAGGIVGRWRKTNADEEIMAVLADAEAGDIADPVSWVPAALKARAAESPLAFVTRAAAHQAAIGAGRG